MRHLVTVREFAVLTTASVGRPSLDNAQVSRSAFDWLCRASASVGITGARLVNLDDARSLRLRNYVGVLETPCGTRIEILPKTFDDNASAQESRRLLARMISVALDLPAREVGETDLRTFDAPLSEWVIGKFLQALNRLVKRGIQLDYKRVDDTARYLRGQLDVPRQLRRPPGRLHEFDIRHDVFAADRPENRLLKRALDEVAGVAQAPQNWRLAQELRLLFRDIPCCVNVPGDFRAWQKDRLMAHYAHVRPWCELILYRRMPYSLVGDWHGISMLFPMERLFERYVAEALQRTLSSGVRLRVQAASEYLCFHDGSQMFRLEPDILLVSQQRRWLLDTKWKRIDARDRANKYGLSQSDLYQLFAYGMKYMGASGGDLVLVYPLTKVFHAPLPVFDLGHRLSLHVLPFDLEQRALVGDSVAGLPLVTIYAAQNATAGNPTASPAGARHAPT